MRSSIADAERVKDCLLTVRFCQGLAPEQIAAMASEFRVRLFEAGETIALAGEPVTEFWILAEGELESFLTDARGRERPLGRVRQGETVGEVMILEKSSTRPVRFTARTHGKLLVAPAESLHNWIASYPRIMQNLFHTLSERFKLVAGAASRGLPSPRLGIVASSPRAYVLAGRLAARLLMAGERLRTWACQPVELASNSWPESLPIEAIGPGVSPLLRLSSPEIDRRIVVWSPSCDGSLEFKPLLGCDEILWLLEPIDAAQVSRELRSLLSLHSGVADKLRIVWLLNADVPVAPMLSGYEFKKTDVKVVVETLGHNLTRQESQGISRLARTLRGITVGIALAGGDRLQADPKRRYGFG